MCSSNTKMLGDFYRDFILDNCCDDRPLNYYPLLDRLVEWMDFNYGSVEGGTQGGRPDEDDAIDFNIPPREPVYN